MDSDGPLTVVLAGCPTSRIGSAATGSTSAVSGAPAGRRLAATGPEMTVLPAMALLMLAAWSAVL